MADLTIGQLTKAAEMTDDALLPLEQGGEARVITGALIKQYARDGVQPSVDAAEAAAGRAESASSHPPRIVNGTWWLYEPENNVYRDSFYPATGAKGDTGATGATGEKGEKGEKGDTGDTGAQGAKGDKGEKGDPFTYADFTPDQLAVLKGEQGEKGEKGEKGDTGATGPKGDKGDTGAQGIQGAKGEKGDKGDTGAQGEKGEKGDTGAGFAVLDYFTSLSALQAAVPSPNPGEAYGVGESSPYDIYIYGKTTGWVNTGKLQGAKGEKGDKGDPGEPGAAGAKGDKGDTGANGATFTPAVDDSGNLSWTNDGGLTNPATVNIKGEKGDKGDTGAAGAQGAQGDKGDKGDPGAQGAAGAAGKSAYAAAQEQGFSGTETDFGAALSGLPTHLSDTNLHISASERTAWNAKAAKPTVRTLTLSTDGWDSAAKTQTVTCSGVSADETAQLITVTPALASQTAYLAAGIRCTGQAADALTFTASTVPTESLTVYAVIQTV